MAPVMRRTGLVSGTPRRPSAQESPQEKPLFDNGELAKAIIEAKPIVSPTLRTITTQMLIGVFIFCVAWIVVAWVNSQKEIAVATAGYEFRSHILGVCQERPDDCAYVACSVAIGTGRDEAVFFADDICRLESTRGWTRTATQYDVNQQAE